jgi:hypothetical protein
VSYEELILEAYDIIIKELKGFISEIDLDEDTGRLRIKLKSGIKIFIRYNNYKAILLCCFIFYPKTR